MKVISAPLLAASSFVNKLCTTLALLCLVGMLACICLQVFARYILSAPPEWTEELARYLMVWMGLLGATATYHQNLDPVLASFGASSHRSWKLAAHTAKHVTGLVYVGVIFVTGWGFVERFGERVSETLEINMGLVAAAVPLHAGVIALHALAFLLAGPEYEAEDAPLQEA